MWHVVLETGAQAVQPKGLSYFCERRKCPNRHFGRGVAGTGYLGNKAWVIHSLFFRRGWHCFQASTFPDAPH